LVPDNALAFEVKNQAIEAEKALKKAQATGAARMADSLIAEKNITENIVISTEGSSALLQELAERLEENSIHPGRLHCNRRRQQDSTLEPSAETEGKKNGHGAGNLIKTLDPSLEEKEGANLTWLEALLPNAKSSIPLVAAANQELGLLAYT
jgi:alanyl-tRNA synthetase